jgi:hypothetical protein
VSTPLGTFSGLDKGLDAAFGPYGASGGVMSWDASQISLMWLFFQPTTPINNPPYNQPAIGSAMAGSYTYVSTTFGNGIEVGSLVGGYGTAFAYDDFSGNWEASTRARTVRRILDSSGRVSGIATPPPKKLDCIASFTN